jgi:RP/EB family microtubule-associated protein
VITQINRLAKCKYQDNLEMIQWLKRYIELQGGPQEHYDPVARRGKAIVELPMKKTGK